MVESSKAAFLASRTVMTWLSVKGRFGQPGAAVLGGVLKAIAYLTPARASSSPTMSAPRSLPSVPALL
jgi:hypothetical protein